MITIKQDENHLRQQYKLLSNILNTSTTNLKTYDTRRTNRHNRDNESVLYQMIGWEGIEELEKKPMKLEKSDMNKELPWK